MVAGRVELDTSFHPHSRTDFHTGTAGDIVNEMQLFKEAPWIPV